MTIRHVRDQQSQKYHLNRGYTVLSNQGRVTEVWSLFTGWSLFGGGLYHRFDCTGISVQYMSKL